MVWEERRPHYSQFRNQKKVEGDVIAKRKAEVASSPLGIVQRGGIGTFWSMCWKLTKRGCGTISDGDLEAMLVKSKYVLGVLLLH